MAPRKRTAAYLDGGLPYTPAKRKKQSQQAEQADCAEQAVGDVASVRDQAEPFRLATAAMPIRVLSGLWTMGKNRQVDPKHVQKLCTVFQKAGLKRQARENRILLLASRQDVVAMIARYQEQEHEVVSGDRGPYDFHQWMDVHGDTKVEIMAGQHRVKALEAYVREAELSPAELWWECDFYDRGKLAPL